MINKFTIKIHFVVLATDIKQDKQYILSINEEDICLPHAFLNNEYLKSLDNTVIKKVQEFVFTNELELMPQLISLHSLDIEQQDQQINCVYGFVINKTDNLHNSFWVEYDYFKPNKYSNLIAETTHKLK